MDAIRARREMHIQSLFSNCFSGIGQTGRQDETMKELSPSACEEQQGSRSQAHRPQTDDALRSKVRTSSPRRVDLHPSRKEGPWITLEGQKDGRTAVFAVSSEPTQGKKDLINLTSLERSPAC